MGEAIDRYRTEVLPLKRGNAKNTKAQLEYWKSHIGDLPLAAVTPALLVQHRDALLTNPFKIGKKTKKRSGATVVRYLAALSHLFTVAMKEWQWVYDNPVRKISKPKESPGRIRFLSDEERERLVAACEESSSAYLYPIVIIALSTGMRLGEIRNLRWSDVDLERGWITLHQTKNGERRGVPLAGRALHALTEHAGKNDDRSGFVFPGGRDHRPVDPRKAWNAALVKAKIENFRFHDLRHSAASYLAMNGASPSEIAAVLGHKTLQMVKRYAHVSDDHKADVVRRMNERIFGASSA